jgi:hypothetical protein
MVLPSVSLQAEQGRKARRRRRRKRRRTRRRRRRKRAEEEGSTLDEWAVDLGKRKCFVCERRLVRTLRTVAAAAAAAAVVVVVLAGVVLAVLVGAGVGLKWCTRYICGRKQENKPATGSLVINRK